MPINVFTHYDKPVGPQGLAGLVTSIYTSAHSCAAKERENPILVPLAAHAGACCLGVALGQYAGMWLGYLIRTL